MSIITLTIEVDPDTDSMRIAGEHGILFYTVWSRMMQKAKAEEREECIQAVRDCIKKHPSSGAVLDTAVVAIKDKD